VGLRILHRSKSDAEFKAFVRAGMSKAGETDADAWVTDITTPKLVGGHMRLGCEVDSMHGGTLSAESSSSESEEESEFDADEAVRGGTLHPEAKMLVSRLVQEGAGDTCSEGVTRNLERRLLKDLHATGNVTGAGMWEFLRGAKDRVVGYGLTGGRAPKRSHRTGRFLKCRHSACSRYNTCVMVHQRRFPNTQPIPRPAAQNPHPGMKGGAGGGSDTEDDDDGSHANHRYSKSGYIKKILAQAAAGNTVPGGGFDISEIKNPSANLQHLAGLIEEGADYGDIIKGTGHKKKKQSGESGSSSSDSSASEPARKKNPPRRRGNPSVKEAAADHTAGQWRKQRMVQAAAAKSAKTHGRLAQGDEEPVPVPRPTRPVATRTVPAVPQAPAAPRRNPPRVPGRSGNFTNYSGAGLGICDQIDEDLRGAGILERKEETEAVLEEARDAYDDSNGELAGGDINGEQVSDKNQRFLRPVEASMRLLKTQQSMTPEVEAAERARLTEARRPRTTQESNAIRAKNAVLEAARKKREAYNESPANLARLKRIDDRRLDANDAYYEHIAANPGEEVRRVNGVEMTRDQAQAKHDADFTEWEKREHPANHYFFRPAVKGLSKIADFAADSGILPAGMSELYQNFAPPTSKFYKDNVIKQVQAYRQPRGDTEGDGEADGAGLTGGAVDDLRARYDHVQQMITDVEDEIRPYLHGGFAGAKRSRELTGGTIPRGVVGMPRTQRDFYDRMPMINVHPSASRGLGLGRRQFRDPYTPMAVADDARKMDVPVSGYTRYDGSGGVGAAAVGGGSRQYCDPFADMEKSDRQRGFAFTGGAMEPPRRSISDYNSETVRLLAQIISR
jgi:hypothetical protein